MTDEERAKARRESAARWRERNREKTREDAARWRKANPEKVRAQWKRKAARLALKGPRIRKTSRPCSLCGGTDRFPSGPCRPCNAKKTAEWMARNPERARALARERTRRRTASLSPEARKLEQRKGNLAKTLRDLGITREQYDAMVEAQGNLCAICGKAPGGRFRHLSIDHCHASGKVRGLLCASCNMCIGSMKDDPTILRAATEYLVRHSIDSA